MMNSRSFAKQEHITTDQLGKRLKKNDRTSAVHVLECIEKIQFIQSLDPHFRNKILYDATLRNLQTMAESIRYIRRDIFRSHSEISWKIIRRLRNDLVHGYLTIDTELAAKSVINHEIGPIKNILEKFYPNWQKAKKTMNLCFTDEKKSALDKLNFIR